MITNPRHVQCVMFNDGPSYAGAVQQVATVQIGGVRYEGITEIRDRFGGSWRPFTRDDARALVDDDKEPEIPAPSTECSVCSGLGHYMKDNAQSGALENTQCAACGGTGLVRVQVGP